jgi:type VI secretion system secreted protein Hcp
VSSRPFIGRLWHAAAGIALAVLASSPARALTAAWLDFDGQIPGESRDEVHRDWMEIDGFDFGGGSPGKPLTGFTLLKRVDKASPGLFRACTTGERLEKARLDLVQQSLQTRPSDICRIELQGVFVTSQTLEGDGENLFERIHLSFERITYSYFDAAQSRYYASFDYETNTGTSGTGNPDTPPNPDSDSDGIPDAWEATYGLSVGTNDANADADSDGFTNREEYLLGTHPKSGSSFFRAGVARTAGNTTITWNAVAAKTYVVEWSPDLTTAFTPVATVTASSGTGTATVPATATLGFYRVRLQP